MTTENALSIADYLKYANLQIAKGVGVNCFYYQKVIHSDPSSSTPLVKPIRRCCKSRRCICI